MELLVLNIKSVIVFLLKTNHCKVIVIYWQLFLKGLAVYLTLSGAQKTDLNVPCMFIAATQKHNMLVNKVPRENSLGSE